MERVERYGFLDPECVVEEEAGCVAEAPTVWPADESERADTVRCPDGEPAVAEGVDLPDGVVPEPGVTLAEAETEVP